MRPKETRLYTSAHCDVGGVMVETEVFGDELDTSGNFRSPLEELCGNPHEPIDKSSIGVAVDDWAEGADWTAAPCRVAPALTPSLPSTHPWVPCPVFTPPSHLSPLLLLLGGVVAAVGLGLTAPADLNILAAVHSLEDSLDSVRVLVPLP